MSNVNLSNNTFSETGSTVTIQSVEAELQRAGFDGSRIRKLIEILGPYFIQYLLPLLLKQPMPVGPQAVDLAYLMRVVRWGIENKDTIMLLVQTFPRP